MRRPGGWLVLAWASLAQAQGAPPPAPGARVEPAPAPAPPPPEPAPAPSAAPAPPPGYPPPAHPPPGYVAPAYVYPPQGGVYVASPAPPPPPRREQDEPGYHLHDGFYLRMSLGAGWAGTRIESSEAGTSDVRVKGAGGGIDLMMGGTPTPGLVLGGGIFAVSASDPRLESGGTSSDLDGDASTTLIGPFIDVFFDSRGGFHLGGAVGFSTFTIKPNDSDSDIDEKPYNGGGVALFTGYDAWISPDWSLGGYVRFIATSGKREIEVLGDTSEEKATSFGFSILFTALYH